MAESDTRTRVVGASGGSVTITTTERPTQNQPPQSPNVVLKLKKQSQDKKVKWDQATVDNEHLNKKKSKCCCIYEKPKLFGESSSDDDDHDDCTNHCRGHRKKDYSHPSHNQPD